MKVKDLIEELKALNQNADVILRSSNFELNNASVAVSFVHQYNEGSKKTQTFTDAFGGGTYSKEIWLIFNGDGSTPVVTIS